MIIEEGTVIVLDEGFKYFLADEIGEIEGYPNKTYYFATGVTENEKINTEDICFIEIEKDGENIYATKVAKDSELFEILSGYEVLTVTALEHPSLKNQITNEFEEEQE